MQQAIPPKTEQVNTSQISGVLRILVPAALAYFGARFIPQEAVGPFADQIVNAVVAVVVLVASVWSFMSNSKKKKIDDVAKMPDVQLVVASSQVADVDLKDNPKVISTLPKKV